RTRFAGCVAVSIMLLPPAQRSRLDRSTEGSGPIDRDPRAGEQFSPHRESGEGRMYDALVSQLRKSDNPSVRWKLCVGVLGDDPTSRSMQQLQGEIRDGAIAQTLLARRGADGRIRTRRDVYDKWHGAHWVFAALADIGYPRNDESLVPLRDQVFEFW